MASYDYYHNQKTKLFFDIETIPASEELKEAAIDSERRKWKNKDFADDDEALFRASALSGNFGRIFCIGYAIDDEGAKIISGEEAKILNEWWKIAKSASKFIGHNIINFDIPFIYKRSIVNKCSPTQLLPIKNFETENIYDTDKQWNRWVYQSTVKLHHLAIALGLPSSKDKGIDGSQVYDFYLEDKHKEIYEYCKRDVELTRKVYKRMTFDF